MQFLEELIPDVETAAAVKQYLEGRLKLLYREQAASSDEWNDAVDSAIRVVVRS